MAQNGITKKQFWIGIIPYIFYILMSGYWIYLGIHDNEKIDLILGFSFLVIAVIAITSLIIQRKRHPIENADIDKNLTESMKGGGIALGIITLGFLIAGLLAVILR